MPGREPEPEPEPEPAPAEQVSLLEDDEGRMHLRNLSAQLARTEEEALNLLFLGDTNRVISETPMNQASNPNPNPNPNP